MDIQQHNDGVDELVLRGVNAGLSVGSRMGRAAGRRFMDTAFRSRGERQHRREERQNRREERRGRRENRRHWRETRREVRGMRRDQWWNDASPSKIANASANLRGHAGDGLWKRFVYWRFRRHCLKRYGIDPERVHQNLGPENAGRERQEASARLDRGVEGLIGHPQMVQQIQQDHRRLQVDENYRDQRFQTPVLVPVMLVPVSPEDNPWIQAGKDQQQASEKQHVASEAPERDGEEVRNQAEGDRAATDPAVEQGDAGVDGVDNDTGQNTEAPELEGDPEDTSYQGPDNPRGEGEQIGEDGAEPEAEPAGDDGPQQVADGQEEAEADLEQDSVEAEVGQDAQTEAEGPEAGQLESQGSAVEEPEAAEERAPDGAEVGAEGAQGSARDVPEADAEEAENIADGPEADGEGPENTADSGPEADGVEAQDPGTHVESGPEATPELQEAEGQGTGPDQQDTDAGADVAEQSGGAAFERQREETRTTQERREAPVAAQPNSPDAVDASNVLAARGGGPAGDGRGPAQPALSRTGTGPGRREPNRGTKGSGRGD